MPNTELTVLLSAYNGRKFLTQQLDSIYKQTYSNIRILVRDDASTDSTLEILEIEEAKGAIEILKGGRNIGVTASFFDLLSQAVQSDMEYVAFCDQDDIWSPNKVEIAVSTLSTVADRPAMFCSRLNLVDEQLNYLGISHKPRIVGFGNALVENIAVGCTMVLNRKAIDLLCQQRLPDEVYVHDWWCYLVISCFGEIIFDNRALIQYRQHSGNAIGATSSFLGVLKRKLSRFFNGRLWISEQAIVFYELFSDQLPTDKKKLVELLIKSKSSFWHRLILIFSQDIWRQKHSDNLILRFVILMNRF